MKIIYDWFVVWHDHRIMQMVLLFVSLDNRLC